MYNITVYARILMSLNINEGKDIKRKKTTKHDLTYSKVVNQYLVPML